jgi:hypothetical protein
MVRRALFLDRTEETGESEGEDVKADIRTVRTNRGRRPGCMVQYGQYRWRRKANTKMIQIPHIGH